MRTLSKRILFLAGLAATALSSAALNSAFADEPPPFSPPGSFLAGGHFMHRDGATLYRAICQGCHMPDARGAQGAGAYPALVADKRLASTDYPVSVVLGGRHGMPSFAEYLDDDQVAAVVNFVRSHFDNQYADGVTADAVARLRKSSTAPGATP